MVSRAFPKTAQLNRRGTPDDGQLSDYYDILLVGRTGMGKSTTANKLLGIYEDPGVEKECKLLSNEQNVRVLDTPGLVLVREELVERNRLIFQRILQQQEKHDLDFRRVLYFLPFRGPPERADWTLQEEIKVMYEFLGEDVFNVMVIIATNRRKCQMEFDEEDISITEKAFTLAFEKATGKSLPKCPPALYLSLSETEVLSRVVATGVTADEPVRKIKDRSLDIMASKKDKGPVVTDGTPDMLIVDDIHKAKLKYLGKNQFQGSCCCGGKHPYKDSPTGRPAVKVVNKKGD